VDKVVWSCFLPRSGAFAGLNATRPCGIRFNVRWLNRIVALGLLLAWMPATSLCFIERAGWLANDDCCSSSSSKAPPNNTTCCALASAGYKPHVYERLTPERPGFVLATVFTFVGPHERVAEPASVAEAPSPPELPRSWQFSSRAALPPRAPSLAS
jgi:hypothetical protein